MTTASPLPAQIVVESFLVNGEKFIKWDDETGVGSPVVLRVDSKGYFLSWTYQNKQVECLDITSIRDTRIGTFSKVPKNPKIRGIFNVENPESNFYSKCLTVVSGPDIVNLTFDNFVSFKENVVVKWSKHILNIVIHPLSQNAPRSAFLEKIFTKIKMLVNEERKIPVKNFYQMFPADRKRVEAALSACNLPKLKTDTINLDDFNKVVFQQFLAQLCPRPEISQIFDLLKAKAKPFLNRDQLSQFVNQIQRDSRLNEELCPPLQPTQIQSLIEKYEPSTITAHKGHLSPEGLIMYLSGLENSILFPDKLLVNQDMTQPLSHYYINSSHNTYLTAGQFSGLSSPEMYRQVLLAGCRCVELDCWKGRPPDEEPIITHGFTMTTEIFFKDVIEAIAESAFKTSPYPIILSFENHVDSPKQQAKMADYCRTIFGDMLLTEPLEKYPLKPGNALPSPKDLMGKILIKNKKNEVVKENGQAGKRGKGTELSSCEQNTGSESTESGEPVEDDVCENEEEELDGEDEGLRKAESDEGTAAQEVRAYEEMSSLVNYIQPRKFDSFDVAKKRNRSYSISSFTEIKALDLIMKFSMEFLQYNKRQMSRIYPKGTRMDSSNYNPHIFWIIGCQMVALNYQTADIPMQLNSCMFEFNGRSGYLLKHEFLRRQDKKFDPLSMDHIDTVVSNTLSITIISGQFLSERSVKCYVEVELFGLPGDPKRKFRTKMLSEPNSINPYWKDEAPFVFDKILLPDLASLRIAVFEDSGKFLGHRILPLPTIQSGYRQMCLLSDSNQPLTLPSLFLHIEIKDYVPDTLADFSKALTNPIQFAGIREQRTPSVKAHPVRPDMEAQTVENKNQNDTPALTSGDEASSPGAPTSPASCGVMDIFKNISEPETLNVTELRSHKAFVKLLKKQEKELREMERRDVKRSEELTNKHSSLLSQLHAQTQGQASKRRVGKKRRSVPNINEEAPCTEAADCTDGPSPTTWKVLELKEKLEVELSSLREEQLEGMRKKKEQHITEQMGKLVEAAKEKQASELKNCKDSTDSEIKDLKRRMELKRQEKLENMLKSTSDKLKQERLKKEINNHYIQNVVPVLNMLAENQLSLQKKMEEMHTANLEQLKETEKQYQEEVQSEYKTKLLALPNEVQEMTATMISALFPVELEELGTVWEGETSSAGATHVLASGESVTPL